jgi:hypothetical protein
VAYVRGALKDYMNKRFEEKGFIVLGWMDWGSSTPSPSAAQLAGDSQEAEVVDP